MTPNDHYGGRTAPRTSKRYILYIYSTNIGTEYFKHGIYSPFFSSSKCSLSHNSNVFGSCIIHILYTECAKIKKNNSGAKRLIICLIVVQIESSVDLKAHFNIKISTVFLFHSLNYINLRARETNKMLTFLFQIKLFCT